MNTKLFAKLPPLLFCLLLISSNFATQARAAEGGYSISRFDAALNVQKNGTIEVTEQIQTRFPESKHGIYRDIETLSTQDGEKVRIRIVPKEITLDGVPVPYTKEETYTALRMKIGDADKTITGKHTPFGTK
jgi:hypothetical protein